MNSRKALENAYFLDLFIKNPAGKFCGFLEQKVGEPRKNFSAYTYRPEASCGRKAGTRGSRNKRKIER